MFKILFTYAFLLFCHTYISATQDSLAATLQRIQAPTQDISQQDSLLLYIHRGLALAKKNNVDTTVVYLLSRLSVWHRMNGEIEEAQQFIDEAFDMMPIDNQEKLQIILLLGQSHISYDKDDLQGAIEHKQQALDLAINSKDSNHIFIAALQIVEVQLRLKPPPQEIFSYLSLASGITMSSARMRGRLNLALGRYYNLIGAYNQSIEPLEKSIEIGTTHEDYRLVKDAYEHLSHSYASVSKFEKALGATRQSMRYLQIEVNKDDQIANLKMQRQIETQQNENRIRIIESQNEIERIKNLRSRQILILCLVVMSLLTGLSLIILSINRKRRQSDLALLEYQKSMASMRNRFYANVSHEFRTPLTVIIGLCNQLAAKAAEYRLIQRNADHLLQLVTQLLDLSKSEVGQLEPKYIHGNIVSFIRYLTESFIYLGEHDGKNVSVYAEERVINMDYDPAFIKHINYNLLSNSLKFTERGATITSHLKKVDNHLIWKVVDTGRGIDPEVQDRIFDRWNKGSESADTGSGLGLAIVKEMVDLLGGSVRLQSKLGEGTSIIIELDIMSTLESKDDTVNQSDTTTPMLTMSDTELKSENIQIALIAEDVPDVRSYIRSCIQDEFVVLEAADGEVALSMALEYIPDLVITDVMMPKMDGIKLTEALRSDLKTNHIPVIILSAVADQNARISGLSQGADAYLSKPFDENELMVTIHRSLKLRKDLAAKYSRELVKEGTDLEDPFIEELERSIADSYHHHGYDVNRMAKDLKLSRIQLYRKLKATIDRTPGELIRTYRLKKAEDLLKKKHHNISEVAYKCGFSDPAHFSRLFSKSYGVSPSDFAKSTY